MPNILVTGAASGIGHAFVQAYASRAPTTDSAKAAQTHIHAIDLKFPSPDPAKTYSSTSQAPQWLRAHVHQYAVDVTPAEEVSGLGMLLDMDDVPLDLVIHSAGVRGLVPSVPLQEYADVAGAESLESMDAATMSGTLGVNTVGTFLVLQTLVPALKRAGHKGGQAKVVVMGSRMGSIGENAKGGGYAYRASKAGVNAAVKSFSVDVPEVVWTVVHPGRVESRLVSIKEDGAMDAGEAVASMVELIDGLDKKHSGTFVDRLGKPIRW